MIYHETIPLKNLGFLFLLIGMGLIFAYVIFIGLISIGVGLNHLQQDGFWVPITVGVLSIAFCFWLFLLFSRLILNQMKEKDTVNI